jgi:hypothetical protein
VTRSDLEQTVAAYGAGLEAELSLLRQLSGLADQEQRASARDDLEAVAELSDERERLMAGLLIVEDGIRPLRPVLAANREDATSIPAFTDVVALHRVASHLVATILSADQETLTTLRDASTRRKAATQAIESGGQTLTAYRRVIAPAVSNAALVDRRG